MWIFAKDAQHLRRLYPLQMLGTFNQLKICEGKPNQINSFLRLICFRSAPTVGVGESTVQR